MCHFSSCATAQSVAIRKVKTLKVQFRLVKYTCVQTCRSLLGISLVYRILDASINFDGMDSRQTTPVFLSQSALHDLNSCRPNRHFPTISVSKVSQWILTFYRINKEGG